MSLTLPDELAWILHRAGGEWPDADEDALGEYARSWRVFAEELRGLEAELAAVARGVRADNEGASIDAFGAFSADYTQQVTDGAEAADLIADGFDGMAAAVLSTKTAIIGVLAEAAARINAAKAAAGTASIGVLLKVLVRIFRWLGPIIWRFLVRLAQLVWRGLVWLFKKAADLFRKIINWFRRRDRRKTTKPSEDNPPQPPENERPLPEIGSPKEFDPESLRGRSPEEVRRAIPEDWVPRPSRKGGGTIYEDPENPGRQIRIMPGYESGNRPDPITHGPYTVVSQNGKPPVKVPLEGNPTLQ